MLQPSHPKSVGNATIAMDADDPRWNAPPEVKVCFLCQQQQPDLHLRHYCDMRVARADGEDFPFRCACPGYHYT